MKTILVIDIPDFVNSITKGVLKPIGTVGKLEIGYGSDDGEMVRFEFINTERALLKPIPHKREAIGILNDYERGKILGFNSCLKIILGETE